MTRHALLIGADKFKDPGLRRLIGPQADVSSLREVLQNPAIGGYNVSTIVNQPHYLVNREIEQLSADRSRSDVLLLYFTGHGVKDRLGQLHFAMPDSEVKYLPSTAVSASFVSQALERTRARTKIIILDCCGSGAFPREMTTKAQASLEAVQHLSGQGRCILTASDAVQYAFIGDGDPNGRGARSIFTRLLVEGLASGDADLHKDGFVDFEELFTYIDERMRLETPGQRPQKWTYEVKGSVVVARSPATPATALSADLCNALNNAIADVRLTGVNVAARLLRSGSPGEVDSAIRALQDRVNDEDPGVRDRAREILEQRFGETIVQSTPRNRPDSPQARTARHGPARSTRFAGWLWRRPDSAHERLENRSTNTSAPETTPPNAPLSKRVQGERQTPQQPAVGPTLIARQKTPPVSSAQQDRFTVFENYGKRGKTQDVDTLMSAITNVADLATCKLADYALSRVSSDEGRTRLAHYLFNGTQIQRNYAALYFKRLGEVQILLDAVKAGAVDRRQAFAS